MDKIQVKCQLCDETTLVDGTYCRTHHIQHKKSQWLDNTDRNNLGIVRWAQECLPELTFNATPDFHLDIYYNYLLLYDPSLRNKYERLLGVEAFRESAKSTTRDIFVSYILAHNGESFTITVGDEVQSFPINEAAIVIISKTAGSAEEFTVRIRDLFLTSERLRYYYGFQIQEAIDSVTGQLTRIAFKMNNCFVLGVGAGQMIRGRVKGFSRPSLVFGDDIYDETNVLTEESRAKIRRWWNNAVMNSIDNLRGKIVVLGTILHEDTILVDIERNPLWKLIKLPVMGSVDPETKEVNLDSFHEFLNTHIKVDWGSGVCVLPHDNIKEDNARRLQQRIYFDKIQSQKDWELKWPERIDLYFLALKFQEAVYNNTVAGFYQEYFHIIVPPHEKRFSQDMMLKARPYELKYMHGYNWIRFNAEEYANDDEGWVNCNVEFGIDLSGKGTDETVISPVAALPDYRVIVLPQVTGKMSIRDDFQFDTSELFRRYKVAESDDPSSRVRTGVVDETLRLAVRYHPSAVKVGVAGEEELQVEELRRVFEQNRLYTIYIQSRPQTSREGRKEQRIFGTLLPYYETRMVYHAPGLVKLEYQLQYLGRSKHDDCADALECAFFNLTFPEKLELSMFKNNKTESESKIFSIHPSSTQSQFNITNNWREYF